MKLTMHFNEDAVLEKLANLITKGYGLNNLLDSKLIIFAFFPLYNSARNCVRNIM